MKARSLLIGAVITYLSLYNLSGAISWAEKEQPLTNDIVIELVKAGLSDAIVIEKIRASACMFDVTPEALIRLRKTGVSNGVISAMLDRSSAKKETVASSVEQSPASYGAYISGSGRLFKLSPKSIAHVVGLRVGGNSDRGSAVDGVSGDPQVALPNNKIDYLIVYEPHIDIRRYVLARLRFVEKMQAYQFNVLGTNPAFFSSIYGVSKEAVIDVNLWRRSSMVNFDVSPVPGTPDMYKVIPRALLRSGRYFLHEAELLHDHDIVFTYPGAARSGSGYYFAVGPPALEETPGQ